MMSSRMPPLLAASALATMLLAPPCHAAGQAGASADKASADDSATFTGKLAADHLLRTAGGTTLTAPRDWSVWRDGPLLLLDAPEPDSHLPSSTCRPATPTTPSGRPGRAIARPTT